LAGLTVSGNAAPTPIRFTGYYVGPLQTQLQELVAEFNKTRPDIVVTYEFVPFHDLKQRLLVGQAAGDLPDVTIIDNPDNAAFAKAGIFVDLTDRVKAWSGNGRFFSGPWNSTLYRGGQYGIPFTSNCLALFYDKNALQKAGLPVPETWAQLRTAAKTLTTKNRYGLVISAVNTEEGTFQYLPWLLSSGATTSRLDSPDAVRSLTFLKSLIDDGSMSPQVVLWTMNDIEKLFASGKAAMMINGPWHFGDLAGRPIDYGVAKVPRDKVFASVLGGENVAIPQGKSVDAAWAFVQFLCSKDSINRFAQGTGFLPPRRDATETGDQWSRDPKYQVFLEEMQYAVPRGPHPQWPAISALVSGALQEGLSGYRTPHDALAGAQEKLTSLMNNP
jgi:multiple sugar transport system substrate-binding protein